MKWALLFCLMSRAIVMAQSAPAYDPAQLLLNVREKVVATVERLPNYICRETVDRWRSAPASKAPASCDDLARRRQEPGWNVRRSQSDKVSFDVAVSKEGEMYSLLGENRFQADRPSALIGTGLTSTGAFGIFLHDIFASSAANFTYKGNTNFQDRTLAEFAYSVPLDKGGYYIETTLHDKYGQDKNYSAAVPYDGTFLVDPQTFDLVRLTVHASQLPKQLKVCETTNALDYSNVQLRDSIFLLPRSARLHVDNEDGSESENDMTFSGCHEFGIESKVDFGAIANTLPETDAGRSSQPPGLSRAQQEQLLAIRTKVMTTVYRLPNYLCTETIDRSVFLPKSENSRACDATPNSKLEPNGAVRESRSDRLRLDVAVSRSDGEMYSWVGENSFHDRSLADLVGNGVTSTGAFSSFLSAIFGGNGATFSYIGERDFRGSRLIEFGFRVPLDKSDFRVGNRKYSSIVPYSGQFLADPKTFDLVRMVVHVDQLPEPLHSCADTTTLDYSTVRLNNAEFLLPQNALLWVDYEDGTESENRTVFSGCHEFLGQSTLRFDAPESSQPEAGTRSAPEPLSFAAGLPFTLALTAPIDSATAAAGDMIKGRLTAALMEGRKRVLVPKGAPVTGRIVQIMRLYEVKSLILAIRLEAIESNGIPQPFPGRLANVVKVLDNRFLGLIAPDNLGSFREMSEFNNDPSVSILRLDDMTGRYVIHPGLQLQGVTIAQPAKPK